MKWDWELTKKAEKNLARLDRTTVGRVFDALDRLAEELMANNPTPAPPSSYDPKCLYGRSPRKGESLQS